MNTKTDYNETLIMLKKETDPENRRTLRAMLHYLWIKMWPYWHDAQKHNPWDNWSKMK